MLKDINFNENLIAENDSALNRNKSNFTLNMNPYASDDRSRQRTDNLSLEYLKEISKSVALLKKNEEDENEKASSGTKFFTNNQVSERQSKKRKSKVTFKDLLVEPEVKKGIFTLSFLN